MSEIRIGIGFDAHAFADGVALVLAGVSIEHPRGLAGHSDGDVVSHALIDAVLGAADLGDIGALFPADEEQYRGASSLDLLGGAYREVRAAGWTLTNADCILIGEELDRLVSEGDGRPARRSSRRRRRPGHRARDDHGRARFHGSS